MESIIDWLMPYLGHLLSVGLGVKRGLSKEDGVLLGGNAELVVEGVVPDLLHVIPVGDDTVLDGVLEGKDTCNRLIHSSVHSIQ